MQHFVVGIDPSLSRTGVAICPLDWGGDWTKVIIRKFESKPTSKTVEARIRRCREMAKEVGDGATLFPCSEGYEYSHFVEDYAYSRAARAHHIGEFGGFLRSELGVGVVEVGIQAARKRLLGKVPREGAKVAVYEALVAAGGKFLSLDESDAMCVCNYGLSELGGFCFMGSQ